MAEGLEIGHVYQVFLNNGTEPVGGMYMGTIKTPGTERRVNRIAIRTPVGNSERPAIWTFGKFDLEGEILRIGNAQLTRAVTDRDIAYCEREMARRGK